ncbi:MAG: MFS transporter [Chloroflexi bacterium]|nr:MFS transporter [Chloroflexota bacterium]
MSVASLARSAATEELNPRRWWILAVMSLTTFMVFLDNTIVNTALPSISRDLGASTATLQWVIDGYTLVLAGFLLVGGTMGDRFGRRRFLILGMLIFGIAASGAALSTDSTMLIGFRGLQGIGAALVLPATLSIVTATFPREERTIAIGVWTATGGLAIGVGPVVGGLIVDEINWAAVFWLHLPVVAIALLGMLLVPESRESRLLRLDIPGALLATSGLFALVFGIIQGNEAGWTSPEIIAAFSAAVILLGAFAVVEARSRAPMLPLRFFKQRDFNGAVLIIGLIFFSLMVTFFFLTQFFQIVQGKSAFTAGAFILPAAGMMLVGAPISAILSKRIGPRALITVAGVAVVGGLIWLSNLDADSSYLTIGLGLAAFGFGGGMALAPLTDTVMAAVPVNDAGIGSAVNDVSRELGAALGIAITGSVVSNIYRSNVDDSLSGVVPADLVDTIGEGIGIANVTAASLPAEVAAAVVEAANTAFIDAFTTGLLVSAGVMVLATGAALVMIPRRRRASQADDVAEFQLEFDRPALPEGLAADVALVSETNEAA